MTRSQQLHLKGLPPIATLALCVGLISVQTTAAASHDAAPASAPPTRADFVTEHHTVIRGRPADYKAVAGETIISDVNGKPTASIFSFSYFRKGAADPTRPVTFVFNGGPGSSSIWLQMGVIGPRRVVLDKDVNPSVVPPFKVEDNPDSILDVTDLVFIDPVGTGFSHALEGTKPQSFYGVDADADSVAQFIELWLTKNGRWNSPKYVIGESYGSVRAAIMPRALMGGPNYTGVMRGVTLNGIVLLGTVLDGHDGADDSDDLKAALALPAMADTAWYHNRIARGGRSLVEFDAEANQFARKDYLAALSRSSAGLLSEAEQKTIAAKLTAFTGVSEQYYLNNNLRIDPVKFSTTLLADQHLDVGKYDSRYTMSSLHTGGDPVADDPAMAQYVPGFVAAFQDMLRNDLKVDMPTPYGAIVWKGLSRQWDWSRAGVPKGQSFAVDLATGMRRDPALKVLVASGYFDLITHPAAARQALEQAGVPQDRTTYKIYESGHMLYLGGTAGAFANDIRALIASSRSGVKN